MNEKVNIEAWLRKAIEGLDMMLFHGDLDLESHPYQISWGKYKKVAEVIQPSDNEEITLADFFPTTICVNFTHKTSVEFLGNIALECIHAFFNEKKSSSKRFKTLALKYYFDKPFNKFTPTPRLNEILEEVYNNLIETYGEFPGKPISYPEKETKQKAKNSFTLFCDGCGMELKATRKMLEKYGWRLPTCSCGHKFACDLSDEIEEQNEEADNDEKL